MKLSTLAILALMTSSIYAGGVVKHTESALGIPTEEIYDNKFFINIAGGVSFLNVDNTLSLNTTFADGALDDKGVVGEIALGYRYSDSIFTTLAVQRTMLDIADINNIYASVNYQLLNTVVKPYVGVLLGYSQLKWSEDPSVVIANRDLTSDGFTYGVQSGVEYSLNNAWGITGKYQFLKYDHVTDIRDGASSIEHTYGQNILMGVNYEF